MPATGKAEQKSLGDQAQVPPENPPAVARVVDWAKLREPTPREAVKWLPKQLSSERQRALLFPYVDAIHVLRALDEACGPGGWEAEVLRESPGAECWVLLRLTLHDGARDVSTEQYGYPARVTFDKDTGKKIAQDDEPLKAAVTDALKRCAYWFGVARDLRTDEYEGGVWVNAKISSKNGKTYLEKLLDDPWEAARQKKEGSEHSEAPKTGPVSWTQVWKQAQATWPEETLDAFRYWLAREEDHPGWAYSNEKEITGDKRAEVLAALKEWKP